MFHREKVEIEYSDIYKNYGLALATWGPLAGGILSGKYFENKDAEGRFTKNDRFKFTYNWDKYFAPDKIEGTKKTFAELEVLAKSLGGNLASLALAWILRNKDVSTVLCAVSKLS